MLEINAKQLSCVFSVDLDAEAILFGIEILGGRSGPIGGINNSGTLTVTNSTISRNNGGGINNSGTLTITNSTISNNSTAGRGGGIYNSGTLTVTNSTISNNSASYSGGGIQMYGRASVSTLNNTIVAGNSASSGSDIYVGWAWLSGSYNLIGNGSDKSELVHGVDGNQVGTSSSPIDPLLSDAGRLLPGSPAINAGSNALAVDAQGNPFITDLDEQATRTDLEYMYHRVRDIPYMDLSTSREEMGMAYRTSKISLREITSPSKNFEDRADLETALEELTIESVFKSRGIIRV